MKLIFILLILLVYVNTAAIDCGNGHSTRALEELFSEDTILPCADEYVSI